MRRVAGGGGGGGATRCDEAAPKCPRGNARDARGGRQHRRRGCAEGPARAALAGPPLSLFPFLPSLLVSHPLCSALSFASAHPPLEALHITPPSRCSWCAQIPPSQSPCISSAHELTLLSLVPRSSCARLSIERITLALRPRSCWVPLPRLRFSFTPSPRRPLRSHTRTHARTHTTRLSFKG